VDVVSQVVEAGEQDLAGNAANHLSLADVLSGEAWARARAREHIHSH